MNKSDQLINQLVEAKLLKLCDKDKAKQYIKDCLIEIHNEAVQATIMASNKKHFAIPSIENI